MARKKVDQPVQDNKVNNAKQSESYISMGLGLLVVLVLGILLFNFLNKNKAKPDVTIPGAQSPTEEKKTEEGKPTGLPTIHTVNAGETLWSIAEKYYNSGYNWVTIVKANNITNPSIIESGQKITIPEAERIVPPASLSQIDAIKENSYTVVKGENLWDIAVRAYADGYQWPRIAKENNLSNPDLIHSGNVLKIPR